MRYYYRMREIPDTRHTQFRHADGSLYDEAVMGIHGFAGSQSIPYHSNPPTRVQKMEVVRNTEIAYEPQEALRHRHFKSAAVPVGGNAVDGRVPMRGNNDVVLYVVRPNEPMDYWYKFGQGDEVIFVHEGTG